MKITEPASAAISTGRKLSESGSMSQESSATAGMRKTATCAADDERDLPGQRDLAARGHDDRAAVLRRVSDDRDDNGRDEEVAQPDLLREGLERADEDLGDERRHDGRRREHEERAPKRPRLDLVVGRDVHGAVPPQRVPGHDDVDDEQRDRDRRRDLREAVGVGVAVPPGTDGTRNRTVAKAIRPNERKLESRSSSPRPPASSAAPSTRRRFETTLPVSDPRTTSVSPSFTAMSAMISSGALPKVAFRNPPMPRARVLRGVLGRLADQPRERDQRERREHELHRLRRVHGVVERDRDRCEGERREKGPPDHRRTLPTPRRHPCACRHCLKTARLSSLARGDAR